MFVKAIRQLHISHNAPYLPLKILHNLCCMGDVQVAYRTLARRRLFTTTNRILQFVVFFSKLGLLSFKHQRD